MAIPIIAQLDNITGDTAYYNRAYDMHRYTKLQHRENGLYSPEYQLWQRNADYEREPDFDDLMNLYNHIAAVLYANHSRKGISSRVAPPA